MFTLLFFWVGWEPLLVARRIVATVKRAEFSFASCLWELSLLSICCFLSCSDRLCIFVCFLSELRLSNCSSLLELSVCRLFCLLVLAEVFGSNFYNFDTHVVCEWYISFSLSQLIAKDSVRIPNGRRMGMQTIGWFQHKTRAGAL